MRPFSALPLLLGAAVLAASAPEGKEADAYLQGYVTAVLDKGYMPFSQFFQQKVEYVGLGAYFNFEQEWKSAC